MYSFLLVPQVVKKVRAGDVHLQLFSLGNKLFQKLVVDAFLHEQARAAETYLSLVGKARTNARWNRLAQIGVVENDIGVLAAKFKRQLLVEGRAIDYDSMGCLSSFRESTVKASGCSCCRLTNLL